MFGVVRRTPAMQRVADQLGCTEHDAENWLDSVMRVCMMIGWASSSA